MSLTLLYNDADQAGNSSAPHPALSPSDGERVAEGRVRGKRNIHIAWYCCDMTPGIANSFLKRNNELNGHRENKLR